MPSIFACQLTQLGQSIPLGRGLPHIGQSGGIIRGSERRQVEQRKSPSLPQPMHRCGNKKSTAIPLSLANRGSTATIYHPELQREPLNILAGTSSMERSAHNGFIKVNITIPDFQVEATIRIGANPSFVVKGCPLTAKIR